MVCKCCIPAYLGAAALVTIGGGYGRQPAWPAPGLKRCAAFTFELDRIARLG